MQEARNLRVQQMDARLCISLLIQQVCLTRTFQAVSLSQSVSLSLGCQQQQRGESLPDRPVWRQCHKVCDRRGQCMRGEWQRLTSACNLTGWFQMGLLIMLCPAPCYTSQHFTTVVRHVSVARLASGDHGDVVVHCRTSGPEPYSWTATIREGRCRPILQVRPYPCLLLSHA